MKKKNPQDATLRNINALKRKVRNIELHLKSVHEVITGVLIVLERLVNKKEAKK